MVDGLDERRLRPMKILKNEDQWPRLAPLKVTTDTPTQLVHEIAADQAVEGLVRLAQGEDDAKPPGDGLALVVRRASDGGTQRLERIRTSGAEVDPKIRTDDLLERIERDSVAVWKTSAKPHLARRHGRREVGYQARLPGTRRSEHSDEGRSTLGRDALERLAKQAQFVIATDQRRAQTRHATGRDGDVAAEAQRRPKLESADALRVERAGWAE